MLFSFAVTLPPDLKHYYVTTDNYLWQKKKKKNSRETESGENKGSQRLG